MKKLILTISIILSTSAFSSTTFIEQDRTGNFLKICYILSVGNEGTGIPVGNEGTGIPVGNEGTGIPVGNEGTGIPVGNEGTGIPVGNEGTGFNSHCEIRKIKS